MIDYYFCRDMANMVGCQVRYKNGEIKDYKLKEGSDIDGIFIRYEMHTDEMPYITFDEIFKSTSYPSVMPKKIIFNGPATIVIWDDGAKTVVKQSKYDDYDYEKGFAMCVVKRVFGDKRNAIRKMVDEAY